MKDSLIALLMLLLASAASFAQTGAASSATPAKAAAAVSVENDPLKIANATVVAHGGDKLKGLKSLIVRGSVDITGAFNQVIPATFVMVVSGERYVFELNNPFQPLKQVYDGKQKYSTGYELPPVTSLGFPLLTRVGTTGYAVTALNTAKKKRSGFRVTTPEGFYTDFIVDEKTSRVKGYESSYDVNGRLVTTSVEVDEFLTVDGVVVPKRYSQRFDLGQMTAYADFKSREILIDPAVADDVFAMPK